MQLIKDTIYFHIPSGILFKAEQSGKFVQRLIGGSSGGMISLLDETTIKANAFIIAWYDNER